MIRTLSTVTPSTAPRIINRMAIGDQGTIPSDPTVPKVPTEDLPQVISTNGLYHEVYRQDVQSSVQTINPAGTTITLTGNLVMSSFVVTTTTTDSLAPGMAVSGTGIPLGTTIQNVNSSTQFTIGPGSATVTGAETLTITGAANQCVFISTFSAVDVALTAYTNPSSPVVNEVGMVIIDPTASSGITRGPVTAPTAPPSDEVVMSIRTFKSVPFEIANDVSITIRYTIFME